MRRREFITLLGGAAAAWPLVARAQQRLAIPVVGYLHISTPESSPNLVAAFRSGLSEAGFVEGRNVAIEYRWAHNESDRLPELVVELLRRRVTVIATPGSGSGTAALAAKAAATTIPIVFGMGGDPVQAGLVASLNRPGGNVTGVNSMGGDLGPKLLGILHELVPGGTRVAVLVNANAANVEAILANLTEAASAARLQIDVHPVGATRDIIATFTNLVQKHADALLVATDPLFGSNRIRLALLAARHAIPAIYGDRRYAEVGGLISYGSSLVDQFRQTGIYTGRVLKGEKPANLPVMRATKFELVINLQAASVLGIAIPSTLLAIADEVIE